MFYFRPNAIEFREIPKELKKKEEIIKLKLAKN